MSKSKHYPKDYSNGYFGVSRAFVRCQDLSPYEKLVYLDLISYSNNETLKAFPSIPTLAKDMSISQNSVRKAIKNLEQKAKLHKRERKWENGGQTSHEYIVLDFPEMWGHSDTRDQEIDNVRYKLMIEELENRGLLKEFVKEYGYIHQDIAKELSSAPTTVTEESPTSSETDNNTEKNKSQEKLHLCNLSIEDIIKKYNLDALRSDYKDQTEHLDALDGVIDILEDLLNTTKSYIWVNKEYKPAEIVIARIKKLEMCHIRHVVDTYCSKKDSVGSFIPFIITSLYNGKVNYDHWLNEKYKESGILP